MIKIKISELKLLKQINKFEETDDKYIEYK